MFDDPQSDLPPHEPFIAPPLAWVDIVGLTLGCCGSLTILALAIYGAVCLFGKLWPY
jgi:hypothetical protein